MTLSEEIELWAEIPGLKNYEASSNGRIRSWIKPHSGRRDAPRILSQSGAGVGYLSVMPQNGKTRRRMYVHRLVLTAFLGEPQQGQEACHNNGIRQDNRLSNLRWDTRKNNSSDKKAHRTHRCGEMVANSKIKDKDAMDCLRSNESGRSWARKLGVSEGVISRLRSRKTFKHLKP